ncbi:MAG TPA: Tol-Pal system beta propeller repeat protein TolB [Nitrospirales bacterium]
MARRAMGRPSWLGLALACSVLIGGALLWPSHAVEVFIDATRGEIKKIPIAVFTFKESLRGDSQNVTDVLKADLRRSLLFEVGELKALGIKPEVNSRPAQDAIRRAGDAGLLVQIWGTLSPKGTDAVLEGTLYDFLRGDDVGGKRYVGPPKMARTMMHRLADEVVFQYTGEQGIARSWIAFVSEVDSGKELFLMDYDGHYPRRLTYDLSLNLAPTWSPDKRRLAFVSYRSGDDPQIEELDLATGRRRTLAAFPGMNITPEWSPSGNELAFASTTTGNSEIYKVDKSARKFERLTDNRAADLAPTWSPTGREIAFTSDRGGSPQIYLMSSDGSNVRRLTFEGSYNTAAAWSPKGNWIAYVCRDDRRLLKICLVSPDGQQTRRLTSGSSNDESPSWAADGRHIAFSSTRDGRRDIYMMTLEGTDQERLTLNGSYNDDPAWSAP